MAQYRRFVPIVLSVLAAIILQIVLVFVDCRETPNEVAISFSKAYFMLNPKMADWLCEKRKTMGDVNVVAYYLDQVAKSAKDRGFDLDYMKSRLYHIQTKSLKMDDSKVEVRITGQRRFAMNPLYDVVGQLFGFTKSQKVDAVLTLVKEGDRWKICGSPFRLPNQI